jgi:hypothetical protein
MLPRGRGGYSTVREKRFRGQLRSNGVLAYIWWPFGDVTRRGLTRGSFRWLSAFPEVFSASGWPN